MAQAMTEAPAGAAGPVDLRGDPRRRRTERRIRGFLMAAAAFSIVISIAIVLSLVFRAAGFASSISLGDIFTTGWFPRRGLFDIPTLVIGSLIVTAIAMLVAAPLGMASAIFLSEYARPRVRRVLKPVLEVLAGIPSVVLGFFALSVISPSIVARINPGADLFNLAAAGIGVGLLTIPLIASVSEDALRSVPGSLREASYGLGSKRITTIVRVVIPAAVSGLIASFILAISRALGETMVVAIATGASGGAERTWNVFGQGQTMTAAMASLATGTDQVRGASNAFASLFFVGLLLFAITVVLNLVADVAVRRFRQRY